MEELQRKLSQRHEERPRKVRFKISSAYSGRVLKQVFEDGHELESPEEEYPHSFVHESFEHSEQYYSSGEVHPRFYPTTRLTAKRISVFRDGTTYRLSGDPILSDDHGMNQTIIRTPVDKTGSPESQKRLHKGGRQSYEGEIRSTLTEAHENPAEQNVQEDDESCQCPQCRGSGCTPCSLCHGSKFSMLANRFKESYKSLRCPACDEKGRQPCQICCH
ncbi:glutaredoxin domain-containing cysteine-rich protein 2 isoform X2 [Xenopus tropicalis]|uniref:Glutaredoxin domain-containing cysteine-rich protein 2 isoform X2 n=1 Tax=Xenopus tropicalis TaxID=8364 RepID=A0A8J1J9Y0_XENTR|nr:glutaredoxin domain-containing cysteine-rich protein 2 isoform X2 [Xenopus tropicalis]